MNVESLQISTGLDESEKIDVILDPEMLEHVAVILAEDFIAVRKPTNQLTTAKENLNESSNLR